MNIPFVDLQIEYRTIKKDVNTAITKVLARSDFVLGQAVQEFEDAFACYCQAAFAVGVDSGFSALELILRAYGIGYGDEVITAANTFVATALAISTCGAKPVFVDIDPDTYNLNPDLLEAAITPATRAIIPVHLYGQPADMDPILAIARQYGLKVIEDACQAHGARYKERRVGGLGDAAAFSFYPSKNLGAFGDGGMIVTNDADIADQAKLLRNLGQRVKYEHQLKGYNHRLDTLQAAILSTKLPYLDERNVLRYQSAATYDRLLRGLPVCTPKIAEWAESVFHLYVIRVQDRDGLQAHLNEAGIATGIHYPVPIHLQPAFQELEHKRGDFPVTEQYSEEILSLPMFPELGIQRVSYVVDAIKAFTARTTIREHQSDYIKEQANVVSN
ncbi:MAG: DegT/DnrJ/EryC1/StrS family aminotransferase [Anaerolineae bacterium]|nr:DegT/DnrJ/EryC1/StrS family aminotransferase [Anaerolineae bacterium]